MFQHPPLRSLTPGPKMFFIGGWNRFRNLNVSFFIFIHGIAKKKKKRRQRHISLMLLNLTICLFYFLFSRISSTATSIKGKVSDCGWNVRQHENKESQNDAEWICLKKSERKRRKNLKKNEVICGNCVKTLTLAAPSEHTTNTKKKPPPIHRPPQLWWVMISNFKVKTTKRFYCWIILHFCILSKCKCDEWNLMSNCVIFHSCLIEFYFAFCYIGFWV